MANSRDQSRGTGAKYVMVLDNRSIRQLANLLALPPRCGTARPSGKWLRQQAELVNRLPPQLQRPKQLLKRLAVKLTEALPTSRMPPAALLCPAHRNLHPWVIHAVFDLLVAEVTLRCDRLQVYGDGEGDDNAEARSKIVGEVVGRLRSINALWLDRDAYRTVFGQQCVHGSEPKLAQVVGGCEACILACIGSRAQVLSDLRANILSRESEVEPRFLRIVESWIDCFDRESAAGIRAQSDWTAAELRKARVFVWKMRKDRLSKRDKMICEHRQRKRDEAEGSQKSKRRTETENKRYSALPRGSNKDDRDRSQSAGSVDSLYGNATSRTSDHSRRGVERPSFDGDTDPLLSQVRAEAEPGPESSTQEAESSQPAKSPKKKDEDFILNPSDAATWETVTVHTTEFSAPVSERPISEMPKRSNSEASTSRSPRPHTFPSFSIGDDGPHASQVRTVSNSSKNASPKKEEWRNSRRRGGCWGIPQPGETSPSHFSIPSDDASEDSLQHLEMETTEKPQEEESPSSNQSSSAPKAPSIRDDNKPRRQHRTPPPPLRERKRLAHRPSPPPGFFGPPSSFYPEGATAASNGGPPPSSSHPPVERRGFMEEERNASWPYGGWTRGSSGDGGGLVVVFRDPWKAENQTGRARKRTESEDWSPTMFRGRDEMF